jgi:hypothetical protein
LQIPQETSGILPRPELKREYDFSCQRAPFEKLYCLAGCLKTAFRVILNPSFSVILSETKDLVFSQGRLREGSQAFGKRGFFATLRMTFLWFSDFFSSMLERENSTLTGCPFQGKYYLRGSWLRSKAAIDESGLF